MCRVSWPWFPCLVIKMSFFRYGEDAFHLGVHLLLSGKSKCSPCICALTFFPFFFLFLFLSFLLPSSLFFLSFFRKCLKWFSCLCLSLLPGLQDYNIMPSLMFCFIKMSLTQNRKCARVDIWGFMFWIPLIPCVLVDLGTALIFVYYISVVHHDTTTFCFLNWFLFCLIDPLLTELCQKFPAVILAMSISNCSSILFYIVSGCHRGHMSME